ncbi:uncharacterized protein BDR25DRAFT_357631 [Lindgomyces ingoldianus]|uniref:Uncharacterized protein n=1 Tax=Lindgomyces ingoldianus TaxID=673940 RepID=A0ACB6QN82_9PLEO|nr:uncharacterized protein BDR25DRAFT_357631 [Lindgomyces ingoldianus]KAF2468332.1 hypothetical protein BDR25DRAFT_357631 [Lindgomyces ingoldianus]
MGSDPGESERIGKRKVGRAARRYARLFLIPSVRSHFAKDGLVLVSAIQLRVPEVATSDANFNLLHPLERIQFPSRNLIGSVPGEPGTRSGFKCRNQNGSFSQPGTIKAADPKEEKERQYLGITFTTSSGGQQSRVEKVSYLRGPGWAGWTSLEIEEFGTRLRLHTPPASGLHDSTCRKTGAAATEGRTRDKY